MGPAMQIVTDLVSPECYLLEGVLERLPEGFSPDITYLPWEEPAADADPGRFARRAAALLPACAKLGLPLRLPAPGSPPPAAAPAFAGYHYALEHGRGKPYYRRVIRALFAEGRDIGQADVLCALAQECGLEDGAFRAALTAERYAQKQRRAVGYAREELRIRAAPTILLPTGRIEGAVVSPEELLARIRELGRSKKTACAI